MCITTTSRFTVSECLNHSGVDNHPERAARCGSHTSLIERHLCWHSDPSLDRERHKGARCHSHLRPHGEAEDGRFASCDVFTKFRRRSPSAFQVPVPVRRRPHLALLQLLNRAPPRSRFHRSRRRRKPKCEWGFGFTDASAPDARPIALMSEVAYAGDPCETRL